MWYRLSFGVFVLTAYVLLLGCTGSHASITRRQTHIINNKRILHQAIDSDGETDLQVEVSTGEEEIDIPVCPLAEHIHPCECKTGSQGLYIFCYREIRNESQLVEIFKKPFPSRKFYEFTLQYSAIETLGNVFNGVSFKNIVLRNLFRLESISADWLEASRDTPGYIGVSHSNITAAGFPFEAVRDYRGVTMLQFHDTAIASVPALSSDSLLTISMTDSPITAIPAGVFDHVPLLHVMTFTGCSISRLREGSIKLDLDGTTIQLSGNRISRVEEGAFVLPQDRAVRNVTLWLHSNRLTSLEESVFGEVFPTLQTFSIHDNPLRCGCALAWIVRSPAYFALLTQTAARQPCPDGTPIGALTPQRFDGC